MAHLEHARGRSSEKPVTGRSELGTRNRQQRTEAFLPILIVMGGLTGWELLVRRGLISPLFFPAPSVIGTTLVQLIVSGELLVHVQASLARILVGLVLGGVPGLVLGLAMGWSRRLRAIVDPFIAAAHPIPKISILPLIMLFFGIGEASRIVVVAIAAFFPMLINTMNGVRQISRTLFDVAQIYHAGLLRTFARVVIPGSSQMILTGLRLSLNSALVLTVVVEIVTAQTGLGEQIWFAWQTFRTERLYASLVVIAALGSSFNFGLRYLTRRLVPWHVERDG